MSRCQDYAELIARAPIDPLRADEEAALADHLRECAHCRLDAVETSELVATLREANDRLGAPSPRFVERLRHRVELEVERSPVDRSTEWVETRRRPAPRARTRRAPVLAVTIASQALLVVLVVALAWSGSHILRRTDTDAKGRAPVAGPIVAAPREIAHAAPPAAEGRLLDSLARLRGEQDQEGLIGGDPLATAWWLVAEARAATGGGAIEPVLRRQIEQARAALVGSADALPSTFARSIVAFGLMEAADRFRIGSAEEALALARVAPGSEPRWTLLSQIAREAPTAGDEREARAALQVTAGASDPESRVPQRRSESVGTTLGVRKVVAALLAQRGNSLRAEPDIAEIRRDAGVRLAGGGVSSPRVEALCTVAALSEPPAAR